MIIVFDVNGTLLDACALAPAFRSMFGRKLSVDAWFNEVLLYSMATSLAGDYREFGDIAIAVLRMAAAARSVKLSRMDIERVRKGMSQLPPFPDVKSGLHRLRDANFRLAALSNSAPDTLAKQLESSELGKYFEQAISVDSVRRYKPGGETYRSAAASLGVGIHEVLMVAAHPWDLLGASRAGCRTAFVSRPGKALFSAAPVPDYVAGDLGDLADQLLKEVNHKSGSKQMLTSRPLMFVACGIAVCMAASALVPVMRRVGNAD